MRSYLLAFTVVLLATEGVNALRCHTCIDYRPWPELNLTAFLEAAGEKGPLNLCRRGVEPSPAFLLPCLSEKYVCSQQFLTAEVSGAVVRYAGRSCVDPEHMEEIGWGDVEMNNCGSSTLDLNPIMPIGPITTETCLCNTDGCNPILNYTGKATRKNNGSLSKKIFHLDV